MLREGLLFRTTTGPLEEAECLESTTRRGRDRATPTRHERWEGNLGRHRSRLRATEYLSTLATRRSLWAGAACLAAVAAAMAPSGAGLLGGGVAPAAAALSCTDDWTGGAGTNDWNNAANWNAGVPDSASVDVCISGGATVVSPDETVSVGEIVVSTGGTLIVGPSSNATDGLSVASGLENDGTVVVGSAGTNTASMTVNGSLTNTGTLTVNGTVTIGTTAVSDLINSGAVSIAPGGVIDIGTTSTMASDAAGRITFGIDGPPTSTSDFGRITNGTFSLGGSADAAFDHGFVPPAGSDYAVYTGHPTGTFATVLHGAQADYAQPNVVGFVGGVPAAPTSTTLTVSDSTPSVFGQGVQLTATVTPSAGSAPTGAVSFYADGAPLGVAGLVTAAGVTTSTLDTSALPVGTPSLTARYSGDVSFDAGTSAALSHSVHPDASTITIAATPTLLVPGQPVTYAVTVSGVAPGGGDPLGTLTLSDNGAPVAGCQGLKLPSGAPSRVSCTETYGAIGSHAVVANYGGDTDFLGSTQSIDESVTQIATTTSVAASTPTSTYGQSVSFTATVAATTGAAQPTGSVTFKDGATILGSSVLSTSDGQTTTSMLLTTLPIGANAITASYDGDNVFLPSASSASTVTVTKSPTTLGLGSSSDPATVGQPVTFTASVFPQTGSGETGTVTFFDNGVLLGEGTLVFGQATLTTAALTAGTSSITARYDGDRDFGGSVTPAPASQLMLSP